MTTVWKKILENRFAGYLVAIFGIAIATTVLKFLGEGINAITVALILLLVVLFTASVWVRPAVLASLMAVSFLITFFSRRRCFDNRGPGELGGPLRLPGYRCHYRRTFCASEAACR